jgi:hypothetical protein
MANPVAFMLTDLREQPFTEIVSVVITTFLR